MSRAAALSRKSDAAAGFGPERGERLARGMQAGTVFIHEIVKADPGLFLNTKTVWVDQA